MIEPIIKYIEEPFLTFGCNQKAIDPRDGLMLFGPFDKTKLKGSITLGIIGPAAARLSMTDYLRKLHEQILPIKDSKKYPIFPGIESTMGIAVNFGNIPQIDVKEENIKSALRHTNAHIRIHELVNLYVDPLMAYMKEEEIPVNLWLVVIPEVIFTYGRPQSKIKKAEDNIHTKFSKEILNPNNQNLFPEFQKEDDKIREAYEYEINFHNQLKARLLGSNIATQIIRDSKISNIGLSEKQIEKEEQVRTAKAWNLASAIYYKLGGLPWKMGEVREGVCYLGLVYKKTDEKNRNACCAAQMFLDSGDGMVFKGNVGPWWNPQTKEFHLSKEDAYNIISQSLESYFSKFGSYPSEVFMHARTYFDDAEWAGFEEASYNKSKIIGVRIRSNNTFKLYRQFSYCVPRGLMLQYDEYKALLWTKGYIPRFKTQIGLETPNPIDIQITRGNANIDIVCKDIMSLTKLNYNACIYGDGLPVTLKFADSIGEILTAGKDLDTGVLPFKFYI